MDRIFLPFLAIQLLLISSACANTLYFEPETDLICPDNTHTCKSDTTCCLLPDGLYGCCMYANAVCCKDNIHCCPTGSYCDVNNGSCNKDGVSFEWSKKAPAALYIPKNKVKKQPSFENIPPINMEFQQPESIPWAEKLPGLKINSLNVSSIHSSGCSVAQTLCKSGSGLSGCCPFPNAVCCDKGQQCCPSGFQCNLKSSKCEKPKEQMIKQVTSLLPGHTLFAIRDPTVCPDALTVCPANTTCCLLGENAYACCPYTSATCCADHKHCCPHDYTCDLASNLCLRKQVYMVEVEMTKWIADQMCPDKETSCPEGTTCCPLTEGAYGCCPYPQAICCSDHAHCCPQGYTCDLQDNRCVLRSSNVQSPVKHMIVCPDKKTECLNTHTCCALSDDTYGCCPYPKAKCCSDMKHCCPDNFICDPIRGRCRIATPTKELSLTGLIVHDLTYSCPISKCPSGSTCCSVSSTRFACCPLPKAVCCQDNKHCCPRDYHCDLEHQRCVMGQTSLPLFKKFLPKKSLTALEAPKKKYKYVMCPDYSECPDRNTCCLMDTGAWGCCPYHNAVCCIDRKHCCPETYFCDMKQSKCVSSRSSPNQMFAMIYSKMRP